MGTAWVEALGGRYRAVMTHVVRRERAAGLEGVDKAGKVDDDGESGYDGAGHGMASEASRRPKQAEHAASVEIPALLAGMEKPIRRVLDAPVGVGHHFASG